MIKNILVVGLIGLFSASAFAGENTVIVKVKPGFNIAKMTLGSRKVEALIPELGIYAVELPAGAKQRALGSLRSNPGIVYAQEDHKVTMRSTPNDKSFNQQWDMLFDNSNWGIDAVGAWGGFGTGGLDAAGNEIVVAVVDGGVDARHSDLADNMWVNQGEIPGNKIDDDGNGYVDDINGWNAFSNNGNVSADRHGTHVAGTVGAIGNNGIHGAGVNWNVKIMGISGSSGNTSVVLKAYGYVLKQKQLWIQTAGKQGANVVATNSSFGVDYADCSSSQYAAWNDIYNEMGKVGILSAAATANNSVDVDVRGDVPTGCDSPYMISVTNTERNGRKTNSAGWGTKTIDIGAPGTSIYSTLPNNSWGQLSGTSMATPHVAGAVAFLHSAANTNFNSLYLQNPAQAALQLKEIMLGTVTPSTSLDGKTVSGGILNLNNASQEISAF